MKKKKENNRAENKRESRFPNRDKESTNRNSCPKGQPGTHPTKRNSTVFLTIKPFIKGKFLFAEGCIPESQTVRAWMMIRIYNN